MDRKLLEQALESAEATVKSLKDLLAKPDIRVNEHGTKRYYVNGQFHREDGPAVEYTNGTKEYYVNGKRHREGGPAIEHPDGSKDYYLNGNLYPKEDYYKQQVVIDAIMKKVIEQN